MIHAVSPLCHSEELTWILLIHNALGHLYVLYTVLSLCLTVGVYVCVCVAKECIMSSRHTDESPALTLAAVTEEYIAV